MANSRGKHTRHNSYQLTNRRRSAHTYTPLTLTHHKPTLFVFPFTSFEILFWILSLQGRGCAAHYCSLQWSERDCHLRLAFCNFNSQNAVETWFESIETFLLPMFGIRWSKDEILAKLMQYWSNWNGATCFRPSGIWYTCSATSKF